jgi:hypothetical protein
VPVRGIFGKPEDTRVPRYFRSIPLVMTDDVMMIVVVYSSIIYCLLLVFIVSYIGPHCPTALGSGFGWVTG